MSPGVSEGVFALIGVALGAGGEYLRDRRAWNREDKTRWHKERLEAYVRFLTLLEETATIAREYRDWVIKGAKAADSGKPEEAHEHWARSRSLLPSLSEKYQAFKRAATTFELMASSKTVESLRSLVSTYKTGLLALMETKTAMEDVLQGRSLDAPELVAIETTLSDQASRLFDLIREELGIEQ